MERASKIILYLLLILIITNCQKNDSEYFYNWEKEFSRTSIGPEFWANRLQDWKLKDGKIVCIESRINKPYRTVNLLTHRLKKGNSDFKISGSYHRKRILYFAIR